MHYGEVESGELGLRASKTKLFDALADIAKALSTGRRVEIVDLLAQGERSVYEVAEEIGQSLANTSHHLRSLANAGLVSSRRDGTHIYYRLAGVEVELLWSALRATAEANRADFGQLVSAYIGPVDQYPIVGRSELIERLKTGAVTLLDVRPEAEYRAGHISGAHSLPYREVEERLVNLPVDGDIVAYCRGSYCVFAPQVVRFLRSKGIAASRLKDGFPEWRRAGLPVTVGADVGAPPFEGSFTHDS